MTELEQLRREVNRQGERLKRLEKILYLDQETYKDIEREEIDLLSDVYNDEIVNIRPKHQSDHKDHI